MREWTAKDIRVAPVNRADANELVRRLHYSHKVVGNSQLHLGVFLGDRMEGVMQFGPSLDKRKLIGLVENTRWNGFIELNRMAFSDRLPRNSESRALGVAFRMMRKQYPHIEWVVSFADGTLCGDGTIYRAAGFVLTQVNRNKSMWEINGTRFTDVGYRTGAGVREIVCKATMTKGAHNFKRNGSAGMKHLIDAGARPLPGFQLRYLYFLNPEARARLTVPILPFSRIDELGARMYKGVNPHTAKPTSGGSSNGATPCLQQGEGGSIPTSPLHSAAPTP